MLTIPPWCIQESRKCLCIYTCRHACKCVGRRPRQQLCALRCICSPSYELLSREQAVQQCLNASLRSLRCTESIRWHLTWVPAIYFHELNRHIVKVVSQIAGPCIATHAAGPLERFKLVFQLCVLQRQVAVLYHPATRFVTRSHVASKIGPSSYPVTSI